MRRLLVVTPCILVAACLFGAGGTPSPLRGYDLLIEGRDPFSEDLAQALSRRGFSVRRHVKGGGSPTAALITFTFRELNEPPTLWFHARLADTRSGVTVAAVSAPLDSLGATAAIRAQSVADSFAAHLKSREPPP
jgi:hypothetical protein